MPVVVACPACQQRARVPEPMLGQSVKCPACGATFTVPADAAATAPPESAPPVAESPPLRPLPADPDALRAARAGTGVQIVGLGLYGVGIALILFMALISMAGSLAPGYGGRGGVSTMLPMVVALFGAILLA